MARSVRKFRAQVGRVLEKSEQAHGVQLLRGLGGKVYVLGTHRRRGDYQGTMQTPGWPDVAAFLPPRPVGGRVRSIFLFWEAKAKGGRLRPEQEEFRALCQDALIEHVVGDLDALIAWLIARNYVHAEQFPHYRQPKGISE